MVVARSDLSVFILAMEAAKAGSAALKMVTPNVETSEPFDFSSPERVIERLSGANALDCGWTFTCHPVG